MKCIVRSYRDPDSPQAIAAFALDATGKVVCDNDLLLGELTDCGVLTGAGHFFPKDGAAFIRHLPWHFTGSFIRAELVEDAAVPGRITTVKFSPEALTFAVDGEAHAVAPRLGREARAEALRTGRVAEGLAPDVRITELAARFWLWCEDGLPESVADNPQPLSAADAGAALEHHLEALDSSR